MTVPQLPLPARLARRRGIPGPRSLFWRIFAVNALVATVAVVLLATTPLTVSNPATSQQIGLLTLGLAAVLVANLVLLRISLRPLSALTRLMGRIDLLQPGERLEVVGAEELNVLLDGFNQMLERLERERRLSSSRAVGRQEDERQQIARELHDQVGQGLAALLLQLKAAIAESDGAAHTALVEAQAIARANLDEVRRIARRLRPTVLDDLGLPFALLALADAAEDSSEFAILRRVAPDVPRVSPAAELAVYRIAQEALTNAARHADAGEVELTLVQALDGHGVRLTVCDDGRGMIYAADVEAGGIRGMRERAVAVGAELTVASRPGGGTSITVEVTAE